MELIQISKLASALGIHRHSLYHWEKTKKVTFTKVKSRNYVTRQEFNRVINEFSSNKTAICVFREIEDDLEKIEKFKQNAFKYCKSKGYRLTGIFEFVNTISEINNLSILLERVPVQHLIIYNGGKKITKIKNKNITIKEFK